MPRRKIVLLFGTPGDTPTVIVECGFRLEDVTSPDALYERLMLSFCYVYSFALTKSIRASKIEENTVKFDCSVSCGDVAVSLFRALKLWD